MMHGLQQTPLRWRPCFQQIHTLHAERCKVNSRVPPPGGMMRVEVSCHQGAALPPGCVLRGELPPGCGTVTHQDQRLRPSDSP